MLKSEDIGYTASLNDLNISADLIRKLTKLEICYEGRPVFTVKKQSAALDALDDRERYQCGFKLMTAA